MTRIRKSFIPGIFLGIFLTAFAAPGFATTQTVTASISAQNTFSDATGTFCIQNGGPWFDFSLSGTWAGTVTLQRSYDGGSTWMDVQTYTANAEDQGYEPQLGVCYRFGIKTGAYTSGTAVGGISQ